VARFSSDVGIHSQQAWVASLILMAAADLVVRALVLWQLRTTLERGPRWTTHLQSA
jgi:hypothetical protein